MEIKASAKYIRTSPKKLRYVLDMVRGMDIGQAQTQLKFSKRRAAGPILKLLNSAIADAKHNFGLETDNLYIKEIAADQGPTLRRWRARAFGRAAPIRRKTSHISIVLEERAKTAVKKRKESLAKPEIVAARPKEEMDIKEGAPIGKKLEKPSPTRGRAKEDKEEPFDVRRKGKRRTKQHLDKVGLKRAGGTLRRIFRRKAV